MNSQVSVDTARNPAMVGQKALPAARELGLQEVQRWACHSPQLERQQKRAVEPACMT